MTEKENPKRLNDEEILHIVYQACLNYKGQADNLRTAIGILFLAVHYGWRVAYLTANRKTIKRSEEILNVNLKDVTLPEGEFSHRSKVLNLIKAGESTLKKFEVAFNNVAYNKVPKPKDCENI